MAFWEALAKGGITGLFEGVGELAKDLRTAFTGEEPMTAEQKAQTLARIDALEAAIVSNEHEIKMGQQALTMQEAQSPSLFKSGWRPALGWSCVFGIAYQFVFRPLAAWATKIGFLVYAAYSEAGMTDALSTLMSEAIKMPSLDMQTLLGLVGTLLGVGTMRTLEKKWGVASK